MNKRGKILIIGPLQNSAGGVVTHIRNLKQLPLFEDAVFYDPGSLNIRQPHGIVMILYRLLGVRARLGQERYAFLLINTSIFPLAFIKLLLSLLLLPRSPMIEVHVFFHGGRFAHSGIYTYRGINRFYRYLLNKVDCCHFLSPVQKHQFEQRFSCRATALYRNYSPHDEIVARSFSDTAPLRLLYVGRLVATKGVFELTQAVVQLRQAQRPVELRFVGDGEDRERLQRQVDSLSDHGIEFSGYLQGSELDQAYRQADLLLLPSYHPEGFPYVVIEAFRFGVPVIATAEGALETLVEEGVTGYRVAAKDPASIVAALEKILAGRARLRDMSNNCHAVFRDQLSRSAAERYYSQLLRVPHAPS